MELDQDCSLGKWQSAFRLDTLPYKKQVVETFNWIERLHSPPIIIYVFIMLIEWWKNMRVGPKLRSSSALRSHLKLLSQPTPFHPRSKHAPAFLSRFYAVVAAENPFKVAPTELLPGLSKDEFRSRRKRFFERLPNYSAFLLTASEIQYSSNDIPYEFRQNSHFLYLTGLEQPDALAVFTKSQSKTEYLLFLPSRDPIREQWDGERAGLDEAIDSLEADAAFELSAVQEKLWRILSHLKNIYVPRSRTGSISLSPPVLQALKEMQGIQVSTGDMIIDSLRLIKSSAEADRMRLAADIAGKGFTKMMRVCAEGMTELALASEFESTCRKHGAPYNSFPCVVGSGKNAAVIHYLLKREILQRNEFVLVDAGCEVSGGYVSDITRTWPVNPTYSSACHRDLYNFILGAQEDCIKHLAQHIREKTPITLNDLHAFSVRRMMEGLKTFGIIKASDLSSHSALSDYYRYNPTHIGHYLGMDVHDTPSIPTSYPIQSGMVVTVEPGIYLPLKDELLPREFRGFGVRIEDDIIIGRDDIEVITRNVPKNLEEIAKLRQSH
uniref:XaaPro aminopeptidase putative n=1 Tax=Albugo laibachii Nc14 TaxID=890382 RepID=F0WA35_9STRA|nr:xaaPro aminopeptidase putative [Albugo laibachii Nc14]|eukprot:CCA18005.1 xaaPro aminopeptidase putative [Albugo laibachii Nc14]